MEGDHELLADMDVKVEPIRDEWMTTLPLIRAQKAKMKYVSLSSFENALSGQLSLSISSIYFKGFCNSFILP